MVFIYMLGTSWKKIRMETKEIEIRVYDKREKSTGNLYVEQLSENKFRMTDNDIFNCRLTKGTEFETR